MKEPPIIPPPDRPACPWVGMLAVVLAYGLAVVLSVRPISSYDIGYHLAYGERFLQTGHIVQSNDFVYTHLPNDLGRNPADMNPGGWVDRNGQYRFVNANWLGQALMAWVYRVAGVNGLEVLQVLLVAGIFGLILLTLHLAGVSPPWIALCTLLAAMVSYERFNLRPELLGFLLLLGQWCLLSRERFGAYKAAGVVTIQLLAVNVHSYYWLAVGLVLAMWADALLRHLWNRAVRRPVDAGLLHRLKWLSFTLGGSFAACFVNPWVARGAIMPLQTILYLRRYHIAGRGDMAGFEHPWAVIGELYSPFIPQFAGSYATWALYVLLVLAGLAAIAALWRRQWGFLIVLVGITLASINVRRNIAVAGMLVGPLSIILLAGAWRRLADRLPDRPGGAWLKALPRRLSLPLAGLALAAGSYLIVDVVSQGFYFNGRMPWRFGGGISRLTVPLSAADWITASRPAGRIYSDQESSSNLLFFTHPHPELPILTNTWATTPSIMKWAFKIATGQLDWHEPFAVYDVQVVVLHSMPSSERLIRILAKSPDWAVVDIDLKHVVFLRRGGPNDALLGRSEITRPTFDTQAFIAKVMAADPVPAFALNNAATLLLQLDYGQAAIALWEKCLQLHEDYYEVHNLLGKCLAARGQAKLLLMKAYYDAGQNDLAEQAKREALSDWEEARRHFERSLELKGDFADARTNLAYLRQDQADFNQGRLVTRPWQ